MEQRKVRRAVTNENEDYPTAVAIVASRRYVQALKILKEKYGLTVGTLVRRAVDEKYGDELSHIMTSFFTSDGK